MSFLLSFVKNGASSTSLAAQNEKKDEKQIISGLLNSLERSSRPEDRRNCIQNLLGYSRTFKEQFAHFGFDILFGALSKGKDDEEISSGIFRILINLCANEDVKKQLFSALVANSADYLKTLLPFLSTEYSAALLKLCIRLLKEFSENKAAPLGINMLRLQPEISRTLIALAKNESFLDEETRADLFLLCIALVCSNLEMQKLMVFEGALEMVMHFASKEGGFVKASYEVHYYLELFYSLLIDNEKNQVFCYESGLMATFVKLFAADSQVLRHWPFNGWSITLIKVFGLFVGVFRAFTSRSNSPQHCKLFQNFFAKHKIIEELAVFSFEPLLPDRVKSLSLLALADFIWKNEENRKIFNRIVLRTREASTTETPTPLLSLAVKAALEEKSRTLKCFRSCCVYLFEAFVEDNLDGQLAIVSTMIPPPDTATSDDKTSSFAMGNALVRAIFDAKAYAEDPMKCFCACALLIRVFRNNLFAKQRACKFLISFAAASDDVSLIDDELNADADSASIVTSNSPFKTIASYDQEVDFLANLFLSLKFVTDSQTPLVVNSLYSLLSETLLNNEEAIRCLVPLGLLDFLVERNALGDQMAAFLLMAVLISFKDDLRLREELITVIKERIGVPHLKSFAASFFKQSFYSFERIHSLQDLVSIFIAIFLFFVDKCRKFR